MCTINNCPSVSSINRILRNRAAERAAKRASLEHERRFLSSRHYFVKDDFFHRSHALVPYSVSRCTLPCCSMKTIPFESLRSGLVKPAYGTSCPTESHKCSSSTCREGTYCVTFFREKHLLEARMFYLTGSNLSTYFVIQTLLLMVAFRF